MKLSIALEKIVQYAVHMADPDKIILFGSYAKGTDNVYSDLDLLLIKNDPYMKNDLSVRISTYAREYALRADVLIHTEEDIKRAHATPYSFLCSIMHEGKIIYEKNNVFA